MTPSAGARVPAVGGPPDWIAGACGLALLALLVATPADAARRDRIVQAVAAQAGRPVQVRVTVGQVVVRAEDRADIGVEIEREVPDASSPEALPVRIEPEPDALRVSALQPGQSRDPALTARVVVAVPPATPVLVELGEGACEVTGTRGPLRVTVGRGGVTLRAVAGLVRAETTAGDIRVERSWLPPDGQLRLRTMTGNVVVDLAERPAEARVLLLAMSGRVQSSLPLEDRGGPGRRVKEAVLGSGRAPLSVDVVRGDITLRMP